MKIVQETADFVAVDLGEPLMFVDKSGRPVEFDGKEIRVLGDMERIQVKPGDIFVLTAPQELRQEVAERLKEHLQRIIGPDAKVLVLSGGLKLGVIGA